MAEEMKRRGLSNLAPNAPHMEKPKAEPKGDDGRAAAGGTGEEKTHTVTEHGDGHFTSRMHDGTETEHPDHLHLMAHIGHHVTGGDKHHVAHHDGMQIHTHGIHEDGQHEGPESHNSAEDTKEAMGHFFDEEAQEPAHQREDEPDMEPSYGGMGA